MDVRLTQAPASAAPQALREAALVDLQRALGEDRWKSVRRCAQRLLELPNQAPEELHRQGPGVVMVAYGGGKDSAYTLAFVRAVQLEIFDAHGDTFRLRVVTNRHAGMPRAVMENIHRTYRALRIAEDDACEALLVDGEEIHPFDVDRPRPQALLSRNRVDVLMAAHRTFADGRPTFCNACNLSVANAFGLASSHGGGVDVIVTGDSPQEQRAYAAWIRRLARQLDVTTKPGEDKSLRSLLRTIEGIGRVYFKDIHGTEQPDRGAPHASTREIPQGLRFFSIYDDTDYASGDHWDLLTGFLGFRFDTLAFSFTESDCANPGLMAHLRGLRSERVFGRSYAEGLEEYVQFALSLMRAKEFPPRLVEMMSSRYSGPAAASSMRAAMDAYAWDTFGLTEEQLVCMVYSPFAAQAQELERFLEREHPALEGRLEEIHEALRDGQAAVAENLAEELTRLSGLTFEQLRILYFGSLRSPTGALRDSGVITAILKDDPHKALITTRHSAEGPQIEELISGR
jgi:hypothetical protein